MNVYSVKRIAETENGTRIPSLVVRETSEWVVQYTRTVIYVL